MNKDKVNSSENTKDKLATTVTFNDEDIHPLNAYFSKRCSKSNRSSILKFIESDSDSSLGVLDLDNLSVLDEMDKIDSESKYSPECQPFLNEKNVSVKELISKGGCEGLYGPDVEPTKSELNLQRQRELAKKALMQLNSRLDGIAKNLKPLVGDGETVQKKTEVLTSKLPVNEKIKQWFDYNQSPQTPKCFKDELNSLSESSFTLGKDCERSSNAKMCDIDFSDFSPSKYKGKDSGTEDGGLEDGEHLGFKSQNLDEVLNRFEEDEKKFIREQGGGLSNSQISHFSEVEDCAERLPWAPADGALLDGERVSIGKYFELRSHSINSLVGSRSLKGSADEVALEEGDPSTLVPAEESSSREKFILEDDGKSNKRWYSSSELNRIREASTHRRHSNESSASTSTVLIQNLLREMDSGLSGTQINDQLLERLGKMEVKDVIKREPESMETPKSSRTRGKTGNLRFAPKGRSERKVNKTGWKPLREAAEQTEEAEFKENLPHVMDAAQVLPDGGKSVLMVRNEHAKRIGFDSSTPKATSMRSDREKVRSKVLIGDGEWAPPRISSIRKPLDLEGSASAEEGDKTLILNSTVISSFVEEKLVPAERPITLEESVAAGDLAVISERINEMQKENASIVSSSPDHDSEMLAVIRELATYPKGSIDCSALAPFLRSRFPNLMSATSFHRDQSNVLQDADSFSSQMNESLPSPDSWVQLSLNHDSTDKVRIVVGVNRIISMRTKNLTKDWVILSIESISIQYLPEKFLKGTKLDDGFLVGDFVTVCMKDTLIPPEETSHCKISVTPKLPISLPIRLKLKLMKLANKESRFQDFTLRVICVVPQACMTVHPKNDVNFGLISQEAFEERTIDITFDGACDFPFKASIDESEHFNLNMEAKLDGEMIKSEDGGSEAFVYKVREGKRRLLQLVVKFQPNLPPDRTENGHLSLKGSLSVGLNATQNQSVCQRIPLVGTVGLAKFLCRPSCSPLIFRTTEIGQKVSKSFPLKNIGNMVIDFRMTVMSENEDSPSPDQLFLAPDLFTLPKDEERTVDVIFTANTKERYTRRVLILQIIPNGVRYSLELIGIVMPLPNGKSMSRASSQSGPTHSMQNPSHFSFKLKSTTQSISWAAVPLDVSMSQTFHILNSSPCHVMARFSFKKETSSFRFMNENGEVLEKLRKVLKPNLSNTMTVVFRPDSIGPYNNSIIIETNQLSGRKMISLNAYGGVPRIFIKNLKSDLNGSKIIRLVNSEHEGQIFRATLEFVNRGNISGFVSIKTVAKMLSLNSCIEIEPSHFVVPPNSRIEVRMAQKLKNDELKRLLSGKDVGKLATVTVTTGDEPSRLRLRKLVDEQGVKCYESISFLLGEFLGERKDSVDKFEDDKLFESIFRKSVETIEIAAIIERQNDISEPTILEDLEETVKEFVTILPAADCSLVSERVYESLDPSSSRVFRLEKSSLSTASGDSSKSREKQIAKWLESLEKP